jgi:hypothetical protein
MIYVLKIIWDYRVPLLELIVRNIVRYPQSATSMSIRYQPAIRYLVAAPCVLRCPIPIASLMTSQWCHDDVTCTLLPFSIRKINAKIQWKYTSTHIHPELRVSKQRAARPCVPSFAIVSLMTPSPRHVHIMPVFILENKSINTIEIHHL